MSTQQDPQQHDDDFLAAGQAREQGIFGEFVGFMKENAKWWLTPFLVVFLLLGVLVALGASGAAPFLYAMF